MDETCFNCAGSASNQYTLILEDSIVFTNVSICAECLPEFQRESWIDIHGTSVGIEHDDINHNDRMQ